MKITSLLQEGITAASSPENAQSPAPKFGRAEKFLEDETVEECTTSGSVASVDSPVGGMQRRGKGSIFAGIKTSDKYPNSKQVKEDEVGTKGFRVTWNEAGQRCTTGLLLKPGALEIAKKLQKKPGATDVKVVPYNPREVDEGVWGDTAKLVGIPAVAGALAVGANHLDQQQPHVDIGGQSAKIVNYGPSQIPDYAMTLQGKDGKTYRVWTTRGSGGGHATLAVPTKEVKENLGGRHRSDGTAGEANQGFSYPGYKPEMSDRELAKLLDKGAEKRRQAEKEKQQGVAEGFDDIVKGVKRAVKGKPSKGERKTHYANKTIGAAQAVGSTNDPTEQEYLKKEMFKNANRYYKVKNAGNKGVAEGAPELLKAEMPMVRHIEQELTKIGYKKGTPEFNAYFNDAIKFYRKFGNFGFDTAPQAGRDFSKTDLPPSHPQSAENVWKREQGVDEAFIAPALSAANSNAEFERQRTFGTPGGGYKGRVKLDVEGKDDYINVKNALTQAAKKIGHHIECGLSGNQMSVFSDSMNSDELDNFIDNILPQMMEETFDDDYSDFDYRDEIAQLENQIKYTKSEALRHTLYQQLEQMKRKYGVEDEEEYYGDFDDEGNRIDEKSKSQAQFRTMAAVAHNPKFAKKVGIKQSVGKEFHKADKGADYKSLPKKVDEGEANLEKALDTLRGSWSGWYPDENQSNPNVQTYWFDDGEGGFYASGTIEHNLKTGQITVDFEDSQEGDEVKGTFNSVGEAMNALRGGYPGRHGGKAPNFDRLGQRQQHGSDDLRKTDRTGRKGTIGGGFANRLKGSIEHNKGKHGPKGMLPEEEELAEEMLANQLYRDLQIFKQGKNKDISKKSKDRELANKPQDKEVQKK